MKNLLKFCKYYVTPVLIALWCSVLCVALAVRLLLEALRGFFGELELERENGAEAGAE